MQNPSSSFIFSYVLKPDKLEGAYQMRNLGNFLFLDEHCLNPWGIYDYQVIKQNVNQGYLGTDYNERFVLVQFDLQYWNVVKQ